MGSLADHITMGLLPEDEELSLVDRLLAYFSRNMIGEVAPEGNVAAPIGSEYTYITTGRKYLKMADDGEATGWSIIPMDLPAGGALTDGDKGDITVADGGATWTIDPHAVTPAKLAQINAGLVLGRVTAGLGDVEVLDAADLALLLGLGSAAGSNVGDFDAFGAAAAAQAYAVARANHTGTQSADTVVDGAANKVYVAADKAKLAGIAAGATANDTDANLKNRANHTGAQAIATITGLQAALDLLAPLASPALTGAPTAPTQAGADNSTKIATTAFVKAITNLLSPIADPVFTGDPKAPTPAANDNDTSIATTAFVQSELASKAIFKSFFAAKGNILGASADDTPAIIAAGTDKMVLTADSTLAAGNGFKFAPGTELARTQNLNWDNNIPLDQFYGISFGAEADIAGLDLAIPAWYDGSPFYVQIYGIVLHTVADRGVAFKLKEGAAYLDDDKLYHVNTANVQYGFFFQSRVIARAAGAHTLKWAWETFTSGQAYFAQGRYVNTRAVLV